MKIPYFPQTTELADGIRRAVAPMAQAKPRVYFTVTPAGFMRWRVYTAHARYESREFFFQYRAIAWARAQALAVYDEGRGLNSGVRIKGTDGRYREEWTYGEDPRNTPG